MTELQARSTIDQLAASGAFSPDIMDRVGEVAPRLEVQSYDQLSANFPEIQTFYPKGNALGRFGRKFQVSDYIPRGDYDQVLAFNLPMAAELTRAHQLALWTLAQMIPDTRIIAMGNTGPLSAGRAGHLTPLEAGKVGIGHDFSPIVRPMLEYLDSKKIESASQAGGSLGATKAHWAARLAIDYDIETPNLVITEPVTAEKQSPIDLANRFSESGKTLAPTIASTRFNAVREARAGDPSLTAYKIALFRLSNLATSFGLANGGLAPNLQAAMEAQRDMRLTMVWGDESLLAPNKLLTEIADDLARKHVSRVHNIVVPGKDHSMLVDPIWPAAIVAEGLRH